MRQAGNILSCHKKGSHDQTEYYTLQKIQSYIKNWRAVHRPMADDSAVHETNLKTMVGKYKSFTSDYRHILKIPKRSLWKNSF